MAAGVDVGRNSHGAGNPKTVEVGMGAVRSRANHDLLRIAEIVTYAADGHVLLLENQRRDANLLRRIR